MARATDITPSDIDGDKVWMDVLSTDDRTYAELVDYQEQLEIRNTELMALRGFLGSIMALISDYLVVTEKDGRIVDVSASFCDALGETKAALVGCHVGEFFGKAEYDRLMAGIGQTIGLRREATLEVALSTATGAAPVESRVAPRLDRRRRITGVILTGRPLGELRRAFADLEVSHEALKQAQAHLVRNEKLASLGRLPAGVAHERNNPISFVYANTHSLTKYLYRFETYFDRVQAGAEREELVALRQDLRLDRELRNLRTAIEGAHDGAKRVLRGTKSDLSIRFEGDHRCLVIGRPGHIQQVVMNLVQNAVDAMAGQDAPEIRLNIRSTGNEAVLDIYDNDPGIPADRAASIFDPFFTTKEVGKGTGLGLSISLKIAQEHGGALSCVPGEDGACFRLTPRRGSVE